MKNERRRIRIGLIFAVLVTVLAFVSVGCAADTYTVCPSGCDYTSIQAAINAAQPGDTIEVHSGTYYENVGLNNQLILKGIDTGGGKPVVDACGNSFAITVSTDGNRLEGLKAVNASYSGIYISHSCRNSTITGNAVSGNNKFGIWIYQNSGSNIITSNNISNNKDFGIYLEDSRSNIIMANTASSNAVGIAVTTDSNNNIITNNIASNNRGSSLSPYSDGISVFSNNNTIKGNIVDGNKGNGIYIGGSFNPSKNIVADNRVSNNSAGIYLSVPGNSNTIVNNTAINNYNGIVLIRGSGNNNLIKNTLKNNTHGILLANVPINKIYLNNFINNTRNVYTTWGNSIDIWNSTEEIRYIYAGDLYENYLGNYWDDYNGIDADEDGIGDTPYYISGDNDDIFPLIEPFENYYLYSEEIPVANFTCNITVGYAPLIVKFTDTSTGDPTLWEWDFGDGNNSEEQNPSHTYLYSGYYNVSLTVRNDFGFDTETKANFITVRGAPEWSENIRLTTDPAQSLYPAIAVDKNNNVHITWQDYRGGTAEIYYTKLDNNGNTLVDDTRLDSGRYPAIAVDKNNNVHITYDYRDEIYYTKLDNNGNALVDDTRLTTDYADSWYPAIAMDTNNNVHITWCDFRDGEGEIYYTKLDSNGNTLVDDTRLTTDYADSRWPTIAVDANNNVHITWMNFNDFYGPVYYTKLDNNGTTLIDDTHLTTSADSHWPVITVDMNNNVHITWSYNRDGDWEIYYTKLDNNGTKLVDDTRITTASADSSYPAIAVDTNSNVHITWGDKRDGDWRIYYTKLDNNANKLVYDTRLTKNSTTSPAIAVDTNNNVHITWYDYNDGYWEIYYKNSCGGEETLIIANFTANVTSGYAPLTVKFTDFSTGNCTSWQWDFGDGNTSEEQNPSHSYLYSGYYNVSLTVSNDFGIDTETKANFITVKDLLPEPFEFPENSGYYWYARSSTKEEPPGNNTYSKENVWKDKDGFLHLKITNKSGVWYCSEVWMNESLGYGKYIFYLASRIDQLDKNVVAGLFTWDNESKDKYYREIDIEFTRWGNPSNPNNAQYNLIPQEDPNDQNKRAHSFPIILTGDYSTHSFEWKGGCVQKRLYFESLHGHPVSPSDPSYPIASWEYPLDKANDIPTHGNENVHINLWLYDTDKNGKGDSPSNETELIIKSFEYEPLFDEPFVDILFPRGPGEAENPVYAGSFDNPHDNISIYVWVMDRNKYEGITGLSKDDFSFEIGGEEASAVLISGHFGQYIFNVEPPEQAVPFCGNPPSECPEYAYDLEVGVTINGYGNFTAREEEAVHYSLYNRADAVVLNYLDVHDKEGIQIVTDIKVDQESDNTYYCGLYWTGMDAPGVGYYGIQTEGAIYPNRHVHFTVFDPPGKMTTMKSNGTDVNCEYTPSEGGGMVCTWDTDWIKDQEYKLIVKASTTNTSTLYSAYFYDYSSSENKFIATLEYPVKDKWIAAVTSFIEDFGVHPNCDADPRSYLVGNGYKSLTDNTIIELYKAEYQYNPIIGCKEHNVKTEGSWFKLETGNGIKEDAELYRGKTILRDDTIIIHTTCPVDIEAIDPEGLKINKQTNEIPSSKYSEYYIDDDNDLDDEIIISDKKLGVYQIKIIPEPGAEPTDTYTLWVSTGDKTTVMAENVPISDIPPEPYFFESKAPFDTSSGNYSSLSGTFNGTIIPSCNLSIRKLYTYPCLGTGGHTEYVKIWNATWTGVEAYWDGYQGDWHNLTFNNSFTLYANETYNYTIRTGSYPQIIHESSWNATGGVITCSEFVDVNGKRHEGWIPAIRLT